MRLSRSPVEPGSTVNARTLSAVSGDEVAVPDPGRLVHLQFRRFAGCPVCNLHLRSVIRRHGEIEAAGVREVVVFHSPAGELSPHTTDLPFAVVADPTRRLYTEFGVERSPRALLSPRAWGPIVRAVLSGVREVARGRERLPSTSPHGGRLGLPADFLIAPGGRVLAAKYGEHVYDQWSVDELLELAATTPRTPRTNPAAR
ncbi:MULTISPECIES: peroxiredoxin-like family protein [Streptomyces]|uniref:AhpC/TSA family protein n=1 Tax=Streptomyces koelreuteriae TaxID=2838015 RepID=A0ABX8G2B9_9ACTN|nr:MULTISPECIES: peroxiredoxin-like family protein [Streptomyces]QWB27317.1 AhpC/TSA family protein [Streptomyces koelreuteriae]UUA10401.1 AhpC/TSA family protein [Streptomyces koelreuteriae]UUA18008.1 AhpC/TSA family protein [Streptomyces sp. CRCS-T-1]